MRIAHVITNLGTGGAEMMLLKLVRARSSAVQHSVISLRTLGTIGPHLEQSGARVFALDLASGKIPGPAAFRLVQFVRQIQPDVIQGWMYHGNVAAAIVQPIADRTAKLMWSIRCSFDAAAHEKLLTRSVISASRILSRRPAVTIYNSTRSMDQHSNAGFSSTNATVVPNGFDLLRFQPNAAARAQTRSKLGIHEDAVVVGHLARVHPMKDQRALLQACVDISERLPGMQVVAVGRDMERLAQMSPEVQWAIGLLGARLRLLPEHGDVAQLLPAFDIFVLSSAWGEGFPNVLGEAMASGVPCVATDVGDAKEIVGDTGIIVPPNDRRALSEAILRLGLLAPTARQALGASARSRVAARYALDEVARRYEALWETQTTERQECLRLRKVTQ